MMERLVRLRMVFVWLALIGVLVTLLPATVSAGTTPPRSTSAYGMDILGLGWQWSYPRMAGQPRMSQSIRLDYLDDMLHKAADAGVRWNRLSVWWCMVEPERNQWFWDDVDAVIQIGRNYGIETIPVLLYTPYWAVDGAPRVSDCTKNSHKNYPPTDMADWDNFVRAIVRRYGPAGKNVVHYWEIWNEPDLPEFLSIENDPGDGTVPVYAEMLNRAAHIVRAEAPGSKILIGGLSDIWGKKFLDQLLALTGSLDVRQSFDIVSYHAYSVHSYKTGLIRNVLVKYGLGSRPLWDTELNYLGWDYDQAKAGVADLYQLMASLDVPRTFWYVSFTSHWGPGIFNSHYPYWNLTPFVPSPFYPAFKAQAAPFQLPEAPTVVAPGQHSQDERPRFEWQAAGQGTYPVVGYKLSVDDELFLGEPRFVRPELDVWVTGDVPNYLPLVLGEGGGPVAFSKEDLSFVPLDATWSYRPSAPLTLGKHYWRVAAVDSQGNVGPYSAPHQLFVRGSFTSFVPLASRRAR